MDARSIAQKVLMKQYPSNWQVHRRKKEIRYALASLIIALPLALCSLSNWGNPSSTLSGFFSLALIFTGIAASLYKTYTNYKTLLIITPEGVVQCPNGNIYKVSSLPFSTIKSMKLIHNTHRAIENGRLRTSHTYTFELYDRSNIYSRWPLIKGFNNASSAKTIQSAYLQYRK